MALNTFSDIETKLIEPLIEDSIRRLLYGMTVAHRCYLDITGNQTVPVSAIRFPSDEDFRKFLKGRTENLLRGRKLGKNKTKRLAKKLGRPVRAAYALEEECGHCIAWLDEQNAVACNRETGAVAYDCVVDRHIMAPWL